ncbi:hypothetical protein C8R42DRAFT_711904 [Lentinula raphanica]|nr:hypothetical protein C8R42DRAFT_711904 [Lentinula raphanica]
MKLTSASSLAVVVVAMMAFTQAAVIPTTVAVGEPTTTLSQIPSATTTSDNKSERKTHQRGKWSEYFNRPYGVDQAGDAFTNLGSSSRTLGSGQQKGGNTKPFEPSESTTTSDPELPNDDSKGSQMPIEDKPKEDTAQNRFNDHMFSGSTY